MDLCCVFFCVVICYYINRVKVFFILRDSGYYFFIYFVIDFSLSVNDFIVMFLVSE